MLYCYNEGVERDLDYISLYQSPTDRVLKVLETSESGLRERDAEARRALFGPNEFEAKRRIRPVALFVSRFKSPLLVLLVIAALISGFLGSRVSAGIILVMVFASVVIDFANTYRSGRAAEKLQEEVHVTATVRRGGTLKEVSIRELVPGDIFTLAAGDLVPADGILLGGRDLFVNEAVLTGESLPLEKVKDDAELRKLWMGTSVVSGEGMGVVAKTGTATRMGEIASRLRRIETTTEFDKNLKDFGLFIFRITFFLVLVIILLNIFFEKKNPLEMFLFAVAIAVGLTPELLPVIITANLARGAVKMSREGVIVKKLSAIHNLGSMDVLCTDKTGTLTEDKIVLVRHVDGFGREDERVLFFGYLHSMFITSVRGSLDKAVQKFRKIDLKGWEKVDEIPFDFERRRDAVVAARGAEAVLVVKGAPEEVLKVSEFMGEGERIAPGAREKIEKEYASLSADGFRVLGVGVKKMPREEREYSRDEEDGLIFLGFLAFLDPPKKTVRATLERMMRFNVDIKIITGDNHLVSEKIAREINLPIRGMLTGSEIASLPWGELRRKVEAVNLFTRVTPEAKEQIIRALRDNGHVVGYLGDGVNDVLSLRAADVGISVNNAVDVAKETADIILLEKGLHPIIEGVVEGRKTFANTFKYLMMALSSNFGNMFSMPIASLGLSFLPMLPSQILLNNFLYDASQLAIPFDRIDEPFLHRAKKFDFTFMRRFMLLFGPLSSLFDFATFFVLLKVFGFSGAAFQTGWFLESIATQTLVVNVIRTRERFTKSMPGKTTFFFSFGAVFFAWLFTFTDAARLLGFVALPPKVLLVLLGIVFLYLLSTEVLKRYFYRHSGHLIEK